MSGGIGGICGLRDRKQWLTFGGMPHVARLFVETSTPRASIALLRGSDCLHEEEFLGDRSHNSLLFAPLERALARLREGEMLGEVVIGTGPGSYSGTRVGIAAGQGVALVHGCPAAGLSSLLAVDSAVPGALAVGDARRGSGWRAEIPNAEPELCGVGELGEAMRRVLATGLPVFSLEPVSGLGLPAELADRVILERPTARALAAAWLGMTEAGRAEATRLPVQPVYLRPPHVTKAKAGHPLLRK